MAERQKIRERVLAIALVAAAGSTACAAAEGGKPVPTSTSIASSGETTPQLVPVPSRSRDLPNVVPISRITLGSVDKQWNNDKQKPVITTPDDAAKYVTIDSRRTGNPDDPTGIYSQPQQNRAFAVALATNGDVL